MISIIVGVALCLLPKGYNTLFAGHGVTSLHSTNFANLGLESHLPDSLLYIITPCSRPEYLVDIRETLAAGYDWTWIIVYSSNPSQHAFPGADNVYEVWPGVEGNYDDEPSTAGNVLRNVGISLVEMPSSYLYFLDDDNIMHPNFWEIVYPMLKERRSDFVTFDQQRTPQQILVGPRAELGKIDTAMFVTQRSLVNESRWRVARYDADGCFAEEMQAKASHHAYISHTCAYYNYFRQNFEGRLRRQLRKVSSHFHRF